MIEIKLQANVVNQVVMIKAVCPAWSSAAADDRERDVGRRHHRSAAPAGEGGWGSAYAMSKGAFHRLAGIIAVEYRPGHPDLNVEPGYVVTERMEVNAKAIGLEGRLPRRAADGAGLGDRVARHRARGRRVQRPDDQRAEVRQGPRPPRQVVVARTPVQEGHNSMAHTYKI